MENTQPESLEYQDENACQKSKSNSWTIQSVAMINNIVKLDQIRLSREFDPHWVPLNLRLVTQLSYD